MASMSYCMFQNAVGDLEALRDRLDDVGFEQLSTEEQKAAREVLELVQELSHTLKTQIDEADEVDDGDEDDDVSPQSRKSDASRPHSLIPVAPPAPRLDWARELKFKCNYCQRQKLASESLAVSRTGGGTYRRPSRTYHCYICADCGKELLDMAKAMGDGHSTVGSSHYSRSSIEYAMREHNKRKQKQKESSSPRTKR